MVGTLLSCGCGTLDRHRRRLTADAAEPSRGDPTGTGDIRRRYEAELRRRFRRVASMVVEAVARRDVLGLGDPTVDAALFVRAFSRDQAPSSRAFAFSRSSDKVAAFMEWLRAMVQEEVLGVMQGTPMSMAASESWQNLYIQSAYQRGLRRAAREMRKAGLKVPPSLLQGAFLRPVHAERAGLIFTRAYEGLRGVTEAMASQMSQVLAQSIIEGLGPAVTARRLTERVESFERARARTVARTEIIAAHAEAALNIYVEMGLEKVTVLAEWATARDPQVCPRCEANEGRTFSPADARGMIPLHPNCRCAFIPVVVEP